MSLITKLLDKFFLSIETVLDEHISSRIDKYLEKGILNIEQTNNRGVADDKATAVKSFTDALDNPTDKKVKQALDDAVAFVASAQKSGNSDNVTQSYIHYKKVAVLFIKKDDPNIKKLINADSDEDITSNKIGYLPEYKL